MLIEPEDCPAGFTVKQLFSVAVPAAAVMDRFLVPVEAEGAIVIPAVICALLYTMKLLMVMPAPRLTAVAPVKLAPIITTTSVCPCVPWLGVIEVMLGALTAA